MISIIIPVLNEALTIGNLLSHLSENSRSSDISEVIVVDGGSTDQTVIELRKFQQKEPEFPLKWITTDKGRARQMNAGAQIATGEVLYFLHADSLPPADFDRKISEQIADGKAAGCFRMRFDKGNPLLRISQWFTRFNLKICRGGDQSLFVLRSTFEEMGGYNESYPVYEDCEFINRLYDKVGFVVIKDYVVTSARKYGRNGTWKLQYHFAVIHLKNWTGATPAELDRYYRKYIIS